MYWDGGSSIIKDGFTVRSGNFEYTIQRLINDGASTAYKAKRDDGKEIFLKQFKDTMEGKDDWNDFISYHHSVLKVLLQLPSSIIEKNYEYFECGGSHFHAKAYEDGSDLKTLIVEKKAKFATRFEVAKIALGILKAVHKKGIIHSDLKPEQFYLVNDSSSKLGFRVKLIDFDHCIIPSLGLYKPATTPEWSSPEHIKNEKIDYYSDVFTMGQIVYTLLTGGRQPFRDSIINDTYDKDIQIKNGYIPINDLFKGKLPDELAQAIDSMMEPNPKDRPTIEEVHKIFLEGYSKKLTPKQIILESNGKSRLIIDTQTITREIVKSTFGNHKEIYNKQFDIIKDKSGEWFIKGYDVPPTAKDARGNVYHFHRTLYNGSDVTSKIVKLEDEGVIKVGSVEFVVRMK